MKRRVFILVLLQGLLQAEVNEKINLEALNYDNKDSTGERTLQSTCNNKPKTTVALTGVLGKLVEWKPFSINISWLCTTVLAIWCLVRKRLGNAPAQNYEQKPPIRIEIDSENTRRCEAKIACLECIVDKLQKMVIDLHQGDVRRKRRNLDGTSGVLGLKCE